MPITGNAHLDENITLYQPEIPVNLMKKEDDLAGLANIGTAQTNLGLGTAATKAITDFLQAVNNLSDIVSQATARNNLGLGSIATHALSELLQAANNLADLTSASTARTNLGLGSSATHSASDFLQAVNNLSEITNAATARLHLGLGSASQKSTTDFLQTINNLSDLINQTTALANLGLGNVNNTSDLNKPISTATQTGLDAKFNIPAGATSQYLRGDGTLASFPSIPSAQVQSDWNETNSGFIDYIKNKPATVSQSAVTRSLNTAYQISTTRNILVNYSVDIATSLSLTSGATGTVFLEIADDSGFTTNIQEIGRFVNSNTGTLAIGLGLTQSVTGNLGGFIPLNKYTRLRTANTLGTPTFTYRSGQEALL
jgi:hypothetical protein